MKRYISLGPPPGLDVDLHKISDQIESPNLTEIQNIIGQMNRKL